MSWDDFMYGGRGCGCSDNRYDPSYSNNRSSNRRDDGCSGRDLIKGVSKNDFIKVFLKNSRPVSGFFAGVSKNVLTLFDCEKHAKRVSTTDICLDDIVAIKTFGDDFDRDDHDHDHSGC